MATRPRGSTFSTRKRSKPAVAPAPRDLTVEGQLCEAIRGRNVVELRYDDDLQFRRFAPNAVYFSTKGKVNTDGVQIANANDPLDSNGHHVFEVGKIKALWITGDAYQPDPQLDRTAPRYKNGIICSV